jgi:hypothetical protein
MLEELRTQIVCECVDVAPLPVTSGGAAAAPAGSAAASMHHGAMIPLIPARTSMCVVSQILGEIAASGGDDEWMYAVGDGASHGATSIAQTRVQKRLGSTDAAAIGAARALLFDTATSHDVMRFSATSTSSRAVATSRSTVDGTSDNNFRVPLAESNRVYLLLGDIARMRERGAVVSANTCAVAGGTTPMPEASTTHLTAPATGGCGGSPVVSPRSLDSHTQRLQQQQAVALEAMVTEVVSALKRWEGASATVFPESAAAGGHASPNVLAAAATVRAILATLIRA